MRSAAKTVRRKRLRLRLVFLLVVSLTIWLIYSLIEVEISNEYKADLDENEQLIVTSKEILSPEPTESRIEEYKDYFLESGLFELPINGASGYTSIALQLREGPSTETSVIITLDAGKGFTIISESGNWWEIDVEGRNGWVMHKYCFINLPDVIPSIVYDNTNTYASKIMSSGKSIPTVTGQKLYDAHAFNERLNKEEFIVPVLYAMAQKICLAQQDALADGNTLIIYEGFRPYAVQRKIVESLSALVNEDPLVKQGVTESPWSMGWFISTGISNHQRGYAIDVSLGKVIKQESKILGEYKYKIILEYTEYIMPTSIHELSVASIIFKSPVSPESSTLWKESTIADNINSEALLLQQYCTNAGLIPLASEWWHFNDLTCKDVTAVTQSVGRFFIQENYSKIPNFNDK